LNHRVLKLLLLLLLEQVQPASREPVELAAQQLTQLLSDHPL
jgi:hypothetical protein